MNEHPLTHILNQLAAEGASADLDLRFAVHQRLETSKTHSPKGVFSMKTSFAHPRRLAATIAIVILLLAAAFLLTPQGRAWAQSVLRFFTHAEGDTLPLQPWQLTPVEQMPTATPGSAADCGAWGMPLCTLSEAQQKVDFPIQQIPGLLEGKRSGSAYVTDGVLVLYYPELQLVQMRQETWLRRTEWPCSQCQSVGASADIQEVQIGTVVGEYVKGSWLYRDQDTPVEWQDSGSQRLYWQDGEMVYTLESFGDQSREQLIQWAASLSVLPIPPDPTPDNIHPERVDSIAEAEALVGYTITSFDPVPALYSFEYASIDYATQSVCLRYKSELDGPPALLLAQGPADLVPALVVSPDRGDTAEPRSVSVGGAQDAFYVFGKARSGKWACTSEVTPSRFDRAFLILTWQFEGRQYDLYTPFPAGKCAYDFTFSELELLRLAENLTGISTHPTDEFDPACTQDIATLEQRTGLDIKLPGWIPEGWVFRGAVSWEPETGVTLHYVNQARQAIEITLASFDIVQTPIANPAGGNLLDLVKTAMYASSDFPPQSYEWLTVNGIPAVLINGSWLIDKDGKPVWYQIPGSTESLWWEENGMLFHIYGPFDGETARTNLITIAESMK